MVAQAVVQRIFGAYDPVSKGLIGVTTSGEAPYSPIMGSAQIVSSLAALRLATKAANVAVFVLGNTTPGDGGGGTYAYVSTDVTTGAAFTGSVTGSLLTVSSVQSGTLAVNQSVNRGDTGASIGTILSLGTGTGGVGTYNLSAASAIAGPLGFSSDNGESPIVGIDGGRWYNTTAQAQTFVTVTDFGAKGDGVTDNTAAFQSALNSMAVSLHGGTVWVPPGKFLISGSLTIPEHVWLRGPLGSVGSERSASFNLPNVNGTLILSNTATINVVNGGSLTHLFIVNQNLLAAYPFANAAAALAAIAAFAGTAILATSAEDTYLAHLRICGFAQAISTTNSDRPKMEWIDIDCTAGVLCNDVFDIGRIYKVHCWPFVTYGYSFSTQQLVYFRSGAGFKFTGHFDGSGVFDCFSYGHQYGYESSSPTGVTFQNCWAEGGGASYIAGQYGFYFHGGTEDQANIIGGGVDTCDIGIYCNDAALKLGIFGVEVYANRTNIQCDNAAGLFIENNKLYYVHVTGGGSPTPWPAAVAHVTLNAPAGVVRTSGNYFFGGTALNYIGYTNASQILGNQFIQCAVGIATDGTTTGQSVITDNNFSTTTTPYVIGNTAFLDNMTWWNNIGVNNTDTLGAQVSNTIDRPMSNWKNVGNANGPRHFNWYARGTPSAKTIVQLNDNLGAYLWQGWDGAAWQNAAQIRAQVSAGIAAGSMPAQLIFGTTPSGGTTAVDRLVLQPDGMLRPTTDNTYSLGLAATRWLDVQAVSAHFSKFVSDTTGLGFYGVTSQPQPTTASSPAVFVAGAGTAVNDASTFDGYTLKQVVKALRTLGMLA